MSALHLPPISSVFRRREWTDAVNERRLARRVEHEELVRIAPGSFVGARAWRGARPIARHAQRVWECAARTQPGTVFSHFAAAALHGIEVLGEWPESVDVSVHRSGGGRSTGRIRRRTRNMDGIELIAWNEHFVTSVSQTVVDLSSVLPFAHGVAVADQALWRRRPGGPLAAHAELRGRHLASVGRGLARASRVIDAASAESDSVRESQSRVVIDELGFPAPVLQQEFLLPSGRRARSDFWWPDLEHAGEFDGVGKYLDPQLLRGRTPEQVLIEEKDREDELRRVVNGLSRWRTPHLERRSLLYDILRSAGLPTSKPRPGV